MNVRKLGSNGAAKIVSVVFAVLLWFHVTSNATFSSKCSLPIRYIGPSDEYIVSGDKPRDATVMITGTGRDLVAFYASCLARSEDRYALVTLNGLSEGTNKVSIDKNKIHLGLFTGLTVENVVNPTNASFTIEIDRLISRTVAVDTKSLPEFRISDSYCVLGKPQVKPAFVVMKGPAGIVGSYNNVPISSFQKKSFSPADSIVKGYIEKPRFVTVAPDIVDVYFSIDQVVTWRISGVGLKLKGFPRKNKPSFKPDSLTVVVKGPKSVVSRLKPDRIDVTVAFSALQEAVKNDDTSISPVVAIPNSPPGVNIIGTEPKFVRFSSN